MTGTVSTSRILTEAATILHTRGWIQREYVNLEGYCAIGAIRTVTEDYGEIAAAQAALAKVLRENGVEDTYVYETGSDEHRGFIQDFELITNWNDDPFRTKDEVVQAMRDAGR